MDDLPPQVATTLRDVVVTVRHRAGDNLKSAVLFGSAAEGRLRPTSDVNLILVFRSLPLTELEPLRECIGFAHSVIRLNTLFLEESELALAAQAFAVKFSDIRGRHRVLYGTDPFAGIEIGREAIVGRLKQVLLNLTLRLREHYVLSGERPEQHLKLIAEISGPLRACAGAILELHGSPSASPKEALQTLTQMIGGRDWTAVIENLSAARQQRALPGDAARTTLLQLAELLQAMDQRAREL
jgi:predicted nucleotidyltransferase